MATRYDASVKEGYNYTNTFHRTSAKPIDRTSLFNSLADATNYAKGLIDTRGDSATSYLGQIIAVVSPKTSDPTKYDVTPYIIVDDANNPLQELGQGSGGEDKVAIFTPENTPQQVYAAFSEGKMCFMKAEEAGDVYCYSLVSISNDASEPNPVFAASYKTFIYTYCYGEEGWTEDYEEIPEISTSITTASDNSKAAGAKAVKDYAQPKLTAGTGISIEGNVISVTGGGSSNVLIGDFNTSKSDVQTALTDGKLVILYETRSYSRAGQKNAYILDAASWNSQTVSSKTLTLYCPQLHRKAEWNSSTNKWVSSSDIATDFEIDGLFPWGNIYYNFNAEDRTIALRNNCQLTAEDLGHPLSEVTDAWLLINEEDLGTVITRTTEDGVMKLSITTPEDLSDYAGQTIKVRLEFDPEDVETWGGYVYTPEVSFVVPPIPYWNGWNIDNDFDNEYKLASGSYFTLDDFNSIEGIPEAADLQEILNKYTIELVGRTEDIDPDVRTDITGVISDGKIMLTAAENLDMTDYDGQKGIFYLDFYYEDPDDPGAEIHYRSGEKIVASL